MLSAQQTQFYSTEASEKIRWLFKEIWLNWPFKILLNAPDER